MAFPLEDTITYGYFWPKSEALGPGMRFCLWLQGCNKRCPGCTSPDLQPILGGTKIPIQEMAEIIIGTQNIEGVTISGGEPMLQSHSLALLLDIVLSVRPELNVILFSGYKKEQLTSKDSLKLLSKVDLLIDGEYIDEKNDNIGLRGSSNQRFLFLTNRLLDKKKEIVFGKRKREIHMLKEYEILTIGIKEKR